MGGTYGFVKVIVLTTIIEQCLLYLRNDLLYVRLGGIETIDANRTIFMKSNSFLSFINIKNKCKITLDVKFIEKR